ncbi:MAG: YraN family protein [Candidatus Berkelbacteria bacterium]|nr:YraN family protein [Candidatus Berkelbacteria bacterium]
MTFERKSTGSYGEELAAKHFKKNGYKIIARNFKTKIGEIDILARQKKDIIIVEVKTKSGRELGEGYEMVNYFKRRKLLQLAKLLQIEYPKSVIRIDIISVDTSKEPPAIRHFESAVEE